MSKKQLDKKISGFLDRKAEEFPYILPNRSGSEYWDIK